MTPTRGSKHPIASDVRHLGRGARRPAIASLASLLVLGLVLAAAEPARPAHAEPSPIKRQQRERMISEPMSERRERREELSKLLREARRRAGRGPATRGDRSRGANEAQPAGRPAGESLVTRAAGTTPANRLVNDRTGDVTTSGQSETSIVAWKNFVLAAWNDGEGFVSGGGDGQGYGYSTDGGVTWTDGGNMPPLPGFPSFRWASDPSLAVNEKTGEFYYSGLCDVDIGSNGIGVVKGTFSGSTFTWQSPVLVRGVASDSTGLDKQWLAADSTSQNLYLSYTRFYIEPGTGDVLSDIQFQRSTDGGAIWSAPIKLSLANPLEDGWVQGSRPAAGPDGAVLVQYYLIGQVDVDYYRVCRSVNGGASFGAPITAVSFFSNFGTGAPGFNRDIGINFSSIAVDRSTGATRGRGYLSWAESFNWYDDVGALGAAGSITGVESNNTPATGTPFTPGVTLRDVLSAGDQDWFSFSATAGQHVLVRLDSLANGLSVDLRLFAPDGTSRLAFCTAFRSSAGTFEGLWTWTLPVSGTYNVAVRRLGGAGGYRVLTGFALRTVERGRDQRDVFVASSDDGLSWSTPSRANDSPVGYDDWLPEITVSGQGRPYVAWYDWRDAPAATAGAESNIALARSDDGGASWTPLGAISDVRTAWTSVVSNIQPNQGDYLSAFANDSSVFIAWSDGRPVAGLSNPDVYAAVWPLEPVGVQVIVTSITADPSVVHVVWTIVPPDSFSATLYMRDNGGAWASFGTVTPDAQGQIRVDVPGSFAGHTLDFRLGVPDGGGGEIFYGFASITVPSGFALTLSGSRPNPAITGLDVAFTLADGSPATLELIDLAGRSVRKRDVGALGGGSHLVDLKGVEPLAPGLYVVRLRQGGRTLTKRVAFVR